MATPAHPTARLERAAATPACTVWHCQVLTPPGVPAVADRGERQGRVYGTTPLWYAHIRSSDWFLQPLRPSPGGMLRAFHVWWRQCSSELLPPLCVRNFRLLFLGQFISSVGDQFYVVALPWLLLDRGGTAQNLGLLLSAYGMPRLVGLLLGGKLSDWLRPRSVMLLADAARTLMLLMLTVLAAVGRTPLWLLCVTVMPLGLFTGLFLPASYAIAPDLIPAKQLQAANAITSSSRQLARLVGSGLGGIVVGQVRAGAALGADALSFIASVGTLGAIRHSHGSQGTCHDVAADACQSTRARLPASASSPDAIGGVETADPAGGLKSTTATSRSMFDLWQLIRQSPLLQAVLVFIGLANVTSGGVIEVALPAYAHGPLAAGATGYGLMLGVWAAGALIGSIVAGGLGDVPRRGRLMLLVTLGESAGIALAPVTGHSFGIIGVISDLAMFGVVNSLSNVLLISLLQQSVPRHLLGRVMGVFLLAAYGIYPLSVALGGMVTQRFGPITMFPLASLALLGAVVYGWVPGALRET